MRAKVYDRDTGELYLEEVELTVHGDPSSSRGAVYLAAIVDRALLHVGATLVHGGRYLTLESEDGRRFSCKAEKFTSDLVTTCSFTGVLTMAD